MKPARPWKKKLWAILNYLHDEISDPTFYELAAS